MLGSAGLTLSCAGLPVVLSLTISHPYVYFSLTYAMIAR